MIGPAPVLALLVGIFHSALYVLVRGTAGGQLPLLVLAAFLGAWAGDALGARLGIDIFRIGDFRLLAASAMACRSRGRRQSACLDLRPGPGARRPGRGSHRRLDDLAAPTPAGATDAGIDGRAGRRTRRMIGGREAPTCADAAVGEML